MHQDHSSRASHPHAQKRGISTQSLAKIYGVKASEIDDVFEILEGICKPLGEDIWKAVQQMKATTPVAPPTKAPASTPIAMTSIRQARQATVTSAATPSRPVSPTKSALRSRTSMSSVGEANTPMRKRSVAFDFDEEPDPEETPTKPWKRRRTTKGDGYDDFMAFRAALTTPHRRNGDGDNGPAPGPPSTTSVATTDEESVGDEDADDELSAVPSQSDHAGSEAEVEDYVEMDIPLNDTDESSGDGAISDSEASTREALSEIEADTPRRTGRIARDTLQVTNSTPRTPTKKQRLASPTKTTPRRHSAASLVSTPKRTSKRQERTIEVQSSESEDEPEPILQRRHRPMLLGHRQWQQRDLRLEKQSHAAGKWKVSMIEKYGLPNALEALRGLAVGAV